MDNRYMIISHYDGVTIDNLVKRVSEESELDILIEYISERETLRGFTQDIVDRYKLGGIDSTQAYESIRYILNPYGYIIEYVNSSYDLEMYDSNTLMIIDSNRNVKYVTSNTIDKDELLKYIRTSMDNLSIVPELIASKLDELVNVADVISLDNLSKLKLIEYLVNENNDKLIMY